MNLNCFNLPYPCSHVYAVFMCLGRITKKRYGGLFTLWQPSDQLSNILRHYVSDLHNFTNNMPALLLLDRNWFSSLCNSHPPLKLFFLPQVRTFLIT